MAIQYKKEFFDRTYTVREAYARVWKYARRYKFRLFIGVVCGMMTAGTLVPFFQIVQPTLQHVESHDSTVTAAVVSEREKSDGILGIELRQCRLRFIKNGFAEQLGQGEIDLHHFCLLGGTDTNVLRQGKQLTLCLRYRLIA